MCVCAREREGIHNETTACLEHDVVASILQQEGNMLVLHSGDGEDLTLAVPLLQLDL